MANQRRHRRRGHGRPLRHHLFVWFGVVIALSLATSVGLTWLLRDADQSGWSGHFQRLEQFGVGRLAYVWEDAEERTELARAIHEDLGVAVRLVSIDGTVLEARGTCPRAPWRRPVQAADGRPLGRAELCLPHGGGGHLALLTVGIFGVLLWWGAGLLARRLTRPLEALTAVARDLGEGHLTRRARFVSARGEVGELARAVNEMADRIEAQLADQRALLATVSHELRTPLGHMRILAETAQERGDATPALAEILEELAEMDALVGNLLASSRLDFGRVDRRATDPVALARRALERAGLDGSADGDLVVADDAPAEVDVDPTLIARALANLVDNAVRHGGGVAQLVVRHSDGRTVFEIHDRGEGFDPALREQLFAPFEGAGSEHAALGLGLALVRRIAEAHCGRAFARNVDGGGACFGLEV